MRGDPGLVLARRLSNAEYNYTIRDLTGVDLRPTREFSVDPANTAGFDNSGESLTMSPALLNKYLLAARDVADDMVLTPDGFIFAAHPMLVETDREKFAIKRIVDFYQRQPTDYADYFRAAWRFKYRAAFGRPDATLAGAASHNNLSEGYERIARFHLSQLAYLATRLDSMPEGDGTVLDHSCPMWISTCGLAGARQYKVACGAGRRVGRHAEDGTLARLRAGWRRQSENVQLVSIDHGSDGSETGKVRDAETRLQRL